MTVIFRSNLPEFAAQLRAIGADFSRKAVRGATAAAAGLLKKRAVERAPLGKPGTRGRIPGTLKRAIYVARARKRKAGSEIYVVSARQGPSRSPQKKSTRYAFYWRFLEGGWIPRGPGQKIRGGRHRKALERSRLASRKISRPFFAPTFARFKDVAVGVFNKRIESAINRYNRIK